MRAHTKANSLAHRHARARRWNTRPRTRADTSDTQNSRRRPGMILQLLEFRIFYRAHAYARTLEIPARAAHSNSYAITHLRKLAHAPGYGGQM